MSDERARLRILAGSFAVLGLGWIILGVIIFFSLGSIRLLAVHSVSWGAGFLIYAWSLVTTGEMVPSGGARVHLRSLRSTRIFILVLILGLLVPLVLMLLGFRI